MCACRVILYSTWIPYANVKNNCWQILFWTFRLCYQVLRTHSSYYIIRMRLFLRLILLNHRQTDACTNFNDECYIWPINAILLLDHELRVWIPTRFCHWPHNGFFYLVSAAHKMAIGNHYRTLSSCTLPTENMHAMSLSLISVAQNLILTEITHKTATKFRGEFNENRWDRLYH